jgi:hypothetical protein
MDFMNSNSEINLRVQFFIYRRELSMPMKKEDIVYSNRRNTSRFSINKSGKIFLVKNDKYLEETVDVSNISYDGIQIVFSNNEFLYKYMDTQMLKDADMKIEFEIHEKRYSFAATVNWIRIYNYGENDYYALSGLNFVKRANFEEDLIDLILDLMTENIYLGEPKETEAELVH